MDVTMFRNRSFRVDNIVLFLAMIVFVPIFFFASEYGQIALGQTPTKASLMLLYFFTGFVVAAQVGGRMLDRIGARRPVIIGRGHLPRSVCTCGPTHVTTLAAGTLIPFIVLAGAGMGLLLGQANTDALNHAPANAYGEATGITQTVRNFGATLGLAVLGTVLVTQLRAHLAHTLTARGLNPTQAHATAAKNRAARRRLRHDNGHPALRPSRFRTSDRQRPHGHVMGHDCRRDHRIPSAPTASAARARTSGSAHSGAAGPRPGSCASLTSSRSKTYGAATVTEGTDDRGIECAGCGGDRADDGERRGSARTQVPVHRVFADLWRREAQLG